MKPGVTIAAEDGEDIEIISAQLQDAVARVKDLVYLPKARRFVALFNRFKWEDAERFAGRNLRVRSGLHFDNVLSVKSHNLLRESPYAIVSLLAIQFSLKDPDDCGGVVEMLFAGGGVLRLEVECLDARLTDLTGPWTAQGRPHHLTEEP